MQTPIESCSRESALQDIDLAANYVVTTGSCRFRNNQARDCADSSADQIRATVLLRWAKIEEHPEVEEVMA